MDRRQFVCAATCSLAIAPSGAGAQTPSKPHKIGLLSGFLRTDFVKFADGLRLELKKHGWVDGENIILLDPRTADGRNERLPALAEELVRLDPAAIVVQTAPATRALQQASRSIPIVMLAVGDPVGYGLVDSFARPAAEKLRVRLQALEVRSPGDFDAAFVAIAGERTQAMLVGAEPLVRSQLSRVAELAAKNRLALAVHAPARFLVPGALITYAPKTEEFTQLTAVILDRILKGANPREMPIMQPTRFELAINLKTAKALDLTIPQSLLLRADEVIQ
ncbi:MAG: ABC transporter substrate-binding protein [Acidobacteriota bacterium]